MQDIENEIRALIAEIIEKPAEEIKPDTRFIEDLGVDSMMAIEILAAIEKKYRIVIPPERMAGFATLSAVAAIAKEYLSVSPNAGVKPE